MPEGQHRRGEIPLPPRIAGYPAGRRLTHVTGSGAKGDRKLALSSQATAGLAYPRGRGGLRKAELCPSVRSRDTEASGARKHFLKRNE